MMLEQRLADVYYIPSDVSVRGMTQQTLALATLMHMDEETHQESSL